MGRSYYLATTGISEIWDLSEKLLFLGPWCFKETNNNLEQNKDYILVPSPWKPALRIKEASNYCYRVYQDLLAEISRELNRIHSEDYPIKYWQVLVGPWILLFTEIFYDRYKRIENAFNLFPDLYTHALSREYCDLSSLDTYDFMDKANGDNFNFKLFSIIIRELNAQKAIDTKFLPAPKITKNDFSYNWKTKIFNLLTKGLFLKDSIMLSDMYHLNNIDKLLVNLNSGYREIGFIEFFDKNNSFLSPAILNNEIRQNIKLNGSKDKFQTLLYQIIPFGLPTCYVEGFKDHNSYFAAFAGTEKIKIIGSSVGWWFNEGFKFFAAKAVIHNTKLIEFQHGSGYETYLSNRLENVALEKDLFYVWGMRPKEEKVRYLPNPHISRLDNSYSQKNDKILFIGVNVPKYHYHFGTFIQPEDMPKYFEDKLVFLRNLDENIKGKLLYRPYHEYGWGEQEIIRREYPDIEFILDDKLVEHMKKVKLTVIDNPHTSFIEALVINVPSIFYWDHDIYLMQEEAEYYFELLRKAGIVYKDPISASKKVNEVCDNPLEWWRGRDVQFARDEFCKRYALAQKDWVKIWVKELKSLEASFGKV